MYYVHGNAGRAMIGDAMPCSPMCDGMIGGLFGRLD